MNKLQIFISNEIQELKTLVAESRVLKSNDEIIGFSQFKDMYGVEVPFQNLENFKMFNDNLKNDSMQNDLKKYFNCTINTTLSVIEAVRSAIKKFVSGQVLSHYTAQKQNHANTELQKKKEVFKDTTFSVILQDSILNCFGKENGCEKLYLSALSTTFNSAKDWGSQKTERLKKSALKNLNNTL